MSTASTADQTAVVVSDNVDYVHAFNSNGFSVTANTTTGALRALCNTSGVNYASWTFRRAPKFFDVVTWTGNGSNPRTISHSLGVAPGMIIIKATNQVNDWYTFHRSAGATQSLSLNQTAIAETGTSIWGSTLPGSSSFTVGNSNSNASGITYVAYLFAHDTDSSGIVQCGSFTTTSGVTDVTLGWRPQFVIIKDLNNISNWQMIDTTRQWDASAFKRLLADNSGSEFTSSGPFIGNSSTGFNMDGSVFGSGRSHIYLAIREPT